MTPRFAAGASRPLPQDEYPPRSALTASTSDLLCIGRPGSRSRTPEVMMIRGYAINRYDGFPLQESAAPEELLAELDEAT